MPLGKRIRGELRLEELAPGEKRSRVNSGDQIYAGLNRV